MQRILSRGDVDQDTMTADEKQTLIDREIRIQQSVEIQKFVPAVVIGCVLMIVVLFSTDPYLILSSGAIVGNFITAIMLTLMLRSYLRLRHRPRPANVSLRRIRGINIGSFVSSFAWVLFSILALRQAEPVTAITIVLGTTAFAFLVKTSSSTKA